MSHFLEFYNIDPKDVKSDDAYDESIDIEDREPDLMLIRKELDRVYGRERHENDYLGESRVVERFPWERSNEEKKAQKRNLTKEKIQRNVVLRNLYRPDDDDNDHRTGDEKEAKDESRSSHCSSVDFVEARRNNLSDFFSNSSPNSFSYDEKNFPPL